MPNKPNTPAAAPGALAVRLVWMGLSAAAVVWAAAETWRMTGSYLLSGTDQYAVSVIAASTKAPDLARVQQAIASIERSVRHTADDPSLHESLGDAHVLAARALEPGSPESTAHLAKAEAAYKQTILLRPNDAQTWAALANVYDAMQQLEPMWQAWQQATKLGPNDGFVQPMLLDTLLARWADAPASAQDWAMRLFERSTPKRQKGINSIAEPYGLKFAVEAQKDTK